MNNTNHSEQLTARYIIKGTATTLSPLLIGAGKGGELAEIEQVRKNGKVYVPGSSIAGSLRSFLKSSCAHIKSSSQFWGTETNDVHQSQSHFIVNDMDVIGRASVKVRDGVRIDTDTGMAMEGQKYDYEVVEPGTRLSFLSEIVVRGGFAIAEFEEMVGQVMAALGDEDFRVGAMTNAGFGSMKFDIRAYKFDFKDGKAVKEWMEFCNSGSLPAEYKLPQASALVKRNTFRIEAYFTVKKSLIVGASNEELSGADKTSIKSNGKFVLPGTSIKGAIRHRALKIYKLFRSDDKAFEKMWGMVNNDGDSDSDAIKSKVMVDETILKSVTSKKQTRIKIDRFTGGTVDGALFEEEPLWAVKHVGEKDMFKICITLKDMHGRSWEEWEAGLLMMLLKDLWTGELAIGGGKGIGRGVLVGHKSTISINDSTVLFMQRQQDGKLAKLATENAAILDGYVAKLTEV